MKNCRQRFMSLVGKKTMEKESVGGLCQTDELIARLDELQELKRMKRDGCRKPLGEADHVGFSFFWNIFENVNYEVHYKKKLIVVKMIRFLIFMKKEEYELYNVSKMSGSTPFRSFFSYGKLMSAKAQAVQLSNRSAILLTVFLKHFFYCFFSSI